MCFNRPIILMPLSTKISDIAEAPAFKSPSIPLCQRGKLKAGTASGAPEKDPALPLLLNYADAAPAQFNQVRIRGTSPSRGILIVPSLLSLESGNEPLPFLQQLVAKLTFHPVVRNFRTTDATRDKMSRTEIRSYDFFVRSSGALFIRPFLLKVSGSTPSRSPSPNTTHIPPSNSP